MPMRQIEHAAASRRRVYTQAKFAGLNPLEHLGSVSMTDNPDEQEEKLLQQFYVGVFALVSHGVAIYFLEFPRTVFDPAYLFRQLEPLMREHGVMEREFADAHAAVAKPELVHDFGEPIFD